MSMANRDSAGVGDGIVTAAAAGLLAIAAAKASLGDAPTADGSAAATGAVTSRPSRAGPAEIDGGGIKMMIERAQMRRAPIAFVLGVIKKFTDDQAGKLAALVAYYG